MRANLCSGILWLLVTRLVVAKKAKCETATLTNGFLRSEYITYAKNNYAYISRTRSYCIAIVKSDWNYIFGKKSSSTSQQQNNTAVVANNSSEVDGTGEVDYESNETSFSYLQWRDRTVGQFGVKRRLDILDDAYTFSKTLLKQYQWIDGLYTDPQTGIVSYGYCNWDVLVDSPMPNGFLGPIIHTVVGDTLQLTVKNMIQDQSYSIQAHGMSSTTPQKKSY